MTNSIEHESIERGFTAAADHPGAGEAAFDLDIGFTVVACRSTLSRRMYSWPFSLGHAFPLGVDSMACTMILQTASGGLIGRDAVRQRISVREGAHVEILGQGAMSVLGADDDRPGVNEASILQVGTGSLMHYRPEIRIVFPRACLRQLTDAVVEPGGALIFSDAVVLHPTVNATNFGGLSSTLRVSAASADPAAIGEQPDRAKYPLSEETQGFRSLPPLLERHRAFATVYLVSPYCAGFTDAALDAVAARVEHVPGVYASVMVLPGSAGISVRMAAEDGEKLRRGLRESHDAFLSLALTAVLAKGCIPLRQAVPTDAGPTIGTPTAAVSREKISA